MNSQLFGRKRRRWWQVLVTVVATAVNPLLGVAVGAAFEYFNQQDNQSRTGLVEYSDADVSTATNNLNTVIIPTVNKIAEKLQAIHSGTVSRMGLNGTADIITTLNGVLKDVAILQSYVDYVKTLNNATLSISLQAIEPFLAQLNVLVTETINNNNLQANTEKVSVKVISSDYTTINGMRLDWNGQQVVKQYEALVHVVGSTTDTVITASTGNQTLSDTVQTAVTTPKPTEAPTEAPTATNNNQQSANSSNGWKMFGLLALGFAVGKAATSSSSKKSSK